MEWRLAAHLGRELERFSPRAGRGPIGKAIFDVSGAEPEQLSLQSIRFVERCRIVEEADEASGSHEAARRLDREVGEAAYRHLHVDRISGVVRAARQVEDELVVGPGADLLEAAARRSELGVEQPGPL